MTILVRVISNVPAGRRFPTPVLKLITTSAKRETKGLNFSFLNKLEGNVFDASCLWFYSKLSINVDFLLNIYFCFSKFIWHKRPLDFMFAQVFQKKNVFYLCNLT